MMAGQRLDAERWPIPPHLWAEIEPLLPPDWGGTKGRATPGPAARRVVAAPRRAFWASAASALWPCARGIGRLAGRLCRGWEKAMVALAVPWAPCGVYSLSDWALWAEFNATCPEAGGGEGGER